jgi:hypothetical protein
VPTALDSRYGKARALAGNVGVADREQEAWTPDWVLDAAREALGGRIGLDPCGASAWTLPEIRDAAGRVKRAAQDGGGWFADVTLARTDHAGVGPHGGLVIDCDALDTDWSDAGTVFQNPPYDSLDVWLVKLVETAALGVPCVHLGPVRPKRVWWWPLVSTGEIVWLNYDVRFRGYKQAHPENLCLVSFNCTIPPLGKRENWRTKCA